MEHQRKPTLIEFVLSRQKVHPEATGEFSILLTQIALAGKIISRELKQAGLAGTLGLSGDTNVFGEEVKKLDQYANQIFVLTLKGSSVVCIMSSEEMAEPAHFECGGSGGRYVVVIDPLDGSSNTDVNGNLGSIFAIFPKITQGDQATEEDLLQAGSQMVAAGYIVYGPGTVFVYATREGVNGFTLDIGFGEFLLSHSSIRIPTQGKYYSVNESYYPKWEKPVQRFVDYLRGTDGSGQKAHSGRYSGSLTADFHRLLLEGGVYLYPGEAGGGSKAAGKLRLLYEAAPLGFVVHQAGGLASTGARRVLDIEPDSLQQRVPLYIGSAEDISLLENLYRRVSAP
jgi:fructose-1,6-bisphosphatase I